MASIPIEVSARHIHLTAADWTVLFGATEIAAARMISQPPQFVAEQRLAVRGPKGGLNNIGIVGPLRDYSQVELAMTDARALGITPPITESGKLEQAADITLIGPAGELTKPIAMVPQRHLHINGPEAEIIGVQDQQLISVHINSPRGAILNNVIVRVHPDYKLALHLDTDEGNACGVTPGMTAELVK